MTSTTADAAASDAAPEPDFDASISFLQMVHPEGLWVLVAIWYPPELDGKSKIETRTFGPDKIGACKYWLKEHHKLKHELYWTVNRIAKEVRKKPDREEFVSIPYLHL